MNLIGSDHISWPRDSETVLVLEPRESGKVGYYFADHVKQVVFWPVECEVSSDTKAVKVELRQSHIGKFQGTPSFFTALIFFIYLDHLVRYYYWYCLLFQKSGSKLTDSPLYNAGPIMNCFLISVN